MFERGLSDEVAELPEVFPHGGLDEVRDAGVAVLAALDHFLDLLGEGLRQVHSVVLVLPTGHSMKIQAPRVKNIYFLTIL